MASETKVGYNIGRDFLFICFCWPQTFVEWWKYVTSDRLVAAVKWARSEGNFVRACVETLRKACTWLAAIGWLVLAGWSYPMCVLHVSCTNACTRFAPDLYIVYTSHPWYTASVGRGSLGLIPRLPPWAHSQASPMGSFPGLPHGLIPRPPPWAHSQASPMGSFPGLPRFYSSVCVQYNTQRRKSRFSLQTESKMGEAWELRLGLTATILPLKG